MKEAVMLGRILGLFGAVVQRGLQRVGQVVSRWTKPITDSRVLGTVADYTRSKPELLGQNLLLRQQLVELNRSVKRPRFTRADRRLFVVLASRWATSKETLLIVKPE